jgi:SagB-type dehydrogenase family enzyme
VTPPDDPLRRVVAYHDGTKHDFNHFARSLGYLDWASQPKPFRSYAGAREVPLFPHPNADAAALTSPPSRAYDALFDADGIGGEGTRLPVSMPAIGYFLRHALGLSAWKRFGASRWSLRVNPSSGNLHPTEAYVLTGPTVWHYAPDRHAVEERCVHTEQAWRHLNIDPNQAFLVGLTSIHWREAWKYGERAFRYCQHDIGHAIAALRLAAALCGWRATLLADWPHDALESVLGLSRPDDFVEAEPEDPACLLLVTSIESIDPPVCSWANGGAQAFVELVAAGGWTGRASQLSEEHVQWTFIDDVADATAGEVRSLGTRPAVTVERPEGAPLPDRGLDASTIILQRRSAVALDGMSWLERDAFFRMLWRTMPGAEALFDVLPWAPRLHLVLFVHRVRDVAPGVYLLVRRELAEPLLRSALGAELDWERADASLPLWRLHTAECRTLAQRLCCDQSIASDGFFSLGMLAEFDGSLAEHGAPFYRRLYWEAGAVGQVLYLEAEAAGARGTGIGCFYDDPVHEVLGIRSHALQSLYHFTVGTPVEDHRLTSEAAYSWETDPIASSRESASEGHPVSHGR